MVKKEEKRYYYKGHIIVPTEKKGTYKVVEKVKRIKGNYYTIDMADRKKYFNTIKEAKEWAKFINEKTAMYPNIYKVGDKKLKRVV